MHPNFVKKNGIRHEITFAIPLRIQMHHGFECMLMGLCTTTRLVGMHHNMDTAHVHQESKGNE